MADLIPARFEAHVQRLFSEHAARGTLYDFPVRKIWQPNPRFDTRVRFHGAIAATPVGPAAGPHTQLAQNLVLSWLGGARILELKTVQLNDTLTLPRPCIDAATIGFNVEWSQELRLAQSREEYVRGWTLIHALAQSGLDGLPKDREVLFDLSVGYDLAGVQSAPIKQFIDGLQSAREQIDALRPLLPAHLRDCDIPSRIVDCATISTFHGCPADQIAAIAEHLMEAHGLHVVVKLNPTLLGYEQVTHLVNEHLGYGELRIPKAAFDADLQFPDALGIIRHLRGFAAKRGLTLGVKLTNTLVVENHKQFFSDGTMYMSGQPLHVIAMSLLSRLRSSLKDDFPEMPVSFSAGIDKTNFPDAVALGMVPVTVCTDLLRTGGYTRLPAYLRELDARMHAVGAVDVDSFILKARAQGTRAVDKLVARDAPWYSPLKESLATPGSDVRGVALAHGLDEATFEQIVQRAALLNTTPIVEGARNDPRYKAAQNARPPKKIGKTLALFDCTNCDKCVPVCPNDANFTYTLEVAEHAAFTLTRAASEAAVSITSAEPVRVTDAHQLANYADFCNECGNCDVFCPEDGGPYVLKPRFFGSEAEMDRHPHLDGLVVQGTDRAAGRFRGVRYRLDAGVLSANGWRVRLAGAAAPEVLESPAAGGTLSTGHGVVMGLLCAAVLAPTAFNPVRAEIEAPAP
jgi:putative selenate reductase